MKHRIRLTVALTVLAASLFASSVAAFDMPVYSRAQLADANFVQSEIVRLNQVRHDFSRLLEGKSRMHATLINSWIEKIDIVLRALNHIDANGFKPDEPIILNCPCVAEGTPDFSSLQLVDYRQPAPPPEKAEGEVFDATDAGVTPPKPLRTPRFDIPPEVVGDGISGKMTLTITVGTDGAPSEVSAKLQIKPELTALVKDQIMANWRFRPGTRKGKAVAVRMPWTLNFSHTVIKPTD